MKTLTSEEFEDRVRALARARKIFNNLTGNNITNSFIAYQEVLAERQREISMPLPNIPRPTSGVEVSYEEVICPDCSSIMGFRILGENEDGYKVQIVCSNPDCDTVYNSKEDISWWQKKLRKEREYDITTISVSSGDEE